MYKMWLKLLGGLLLGYMTLDRGFAHLGVPPIYVGEVVLVPGLLMALVPGAVTPALATACGQIYLVFATFSLCCSIPYFGLYGADTIRDAAIWIYGAFFLLVASLMVRRPRMLRRVPAIYGRLLLWYTPLLCILLALRFALHANDEAAGGSRFFSIKLGDMGAHLGGVFAYLLLSLDLLWQRPTAQPRPSIRYVVTAACAMIAFVFVSLINRGGMLSVVVSCLLVAVLAPRLSWRRSTWILAGALMAVFLVFGVAGAQIRVSAERTLSLEQLETNVVSILFPQASANTGASNTARWRMMWWKKIVGYTFGGSYFWTGKGYGINLADADGFQLSKENALRAPHNSSMSILARSGVPGFLLWFMLLSTFFVQMVRLVLRARKEDRPVWSRVALWCLAYWTAMVVDSCFDVALEGPQLGIWFWSLMGFGVALQISYPRYSGSALRRDASLAPVSVRSGVARAPYNPGIEQPSLSGAGSVAMIHPHATEGI